DFHVTGVQTCALPICEALGIELGEITDVNSPIYRSLMDVIDDLSPEIGDVLKPLLEDVANATTEADARAAVGAVEAAINSMPARSEERRVGSEGRCRW